MSAMKNIIFLGGIHGAGKTAFAPALCGGLGLVHETASSLIKSAWNDKRVENISGNQANLIKAVNNLDRTRKYLLDGHFCLLSKTGQVQPIDVDVFEKLFLAAVIILRENAEVIQERILRRDNRSHTLEFLNAFQERELKHAKQVSEMLDMPMQVITPSKSGDEILAKNFIEEVFS